MSSDDLQTYFDSIFAEKGEISEGEKKIILILIDTTLQYRDELLRNTGQTLTIEETQMALHIYMNAVRTGKMPANTEKKIGQLIKLWLEKVNGMTF